MIINRKVSRTAQGRVTRRRVRLIRPPPGSSEEEPGKIFSTPWNINRAVPAHHNNIAGAQFELFCRIAAPQTAVTETATVAERNRDHWRGKIILVAVLVQAHPRGRIVEIDQAGLRRMRIGAPPHARCFARVKGWQAKASR